MYKIKQTPEDFVVVERLKLNLNDKGRYSYYLLKKRDYSTFKAIEVISKKLRIKPKFVNAAGLKDKQAVTEQYISINRGPKKDFKFKDISLKYQGCGEERINIGTLEGNEFEIVVRNLDKGFVPKKIDKIVNYFDEQRFGRDKDNHLIGKLIIQNNFKEAVEILQKKDINMGEYLKKEPTNFIGALRSIPKRILKFYIVAYQSHLWNVCVKEFVKKKTASNEMFPLLGFDVDEDAGKMKIMDNLLEKEKIHPRQFIIRQMPDLTLESFERPVFAEVEDLNITKPEKDEMNKGKYRVKVSFYLGKGSYATNVIREMFG